MRPHHTPLTQRYRDLDRRGASRMLSGLAVLSLLLGGSGLVIAPTAAAATVAAATVAAAAPSAVSLSVVAGPTRGGTSVDLSGPDVGATTKVWFGQTVVSRITKVSATRVRVATPAHAAGVVNVRVTTPAGTSPVSSRASFAFDPVPAVISLSTYSATTAGGATVTLTGAGLYRASAVRFGTTAARGVVRVSATQVRVTVPAHAAGTVDVSVTTPGGTSAATSRARFTYTRPPVVTPPTVTPPTVTRLSVAAGPVRGGTVVTITGTRFTGATSVAFGSTAARFTVLSSTQVRATAPAHTAGLVNVRVRTAAGTSGPYAPSAYAYEAVPTLTRASPTSGPTSGGQSLTLTGTGLTRATTVTFGSTRATALTLGSATTLRVTVPAHAAGTVDVRVTTPGGTSPVATGARYRYGFPPVVTGLSVGAGPLLGGTVVTISGAHLAEAASVRFGSVAATGLVRVSDSTLRVTAPAQAEGTVAVRVASVNGTSPETTTGRFTYVGVPAVSALSTEAGPLRGGSVVTVGGTRLGLVTRVDFGGVAGTGLVRLSDTQLRITSPARVAGTVDVRVTTAGGVSLGTSSTRFTYQAVPTVTSVSPALAPTKGGGVVTLSGTAYDRVSAVTFGTVRATALTRVSATQLRVTLPTHAEGDVDVRVTTPGGSSAVVLAGRFTFQDVPVVSSLTPATGPLAGGTLVTLRGSSFTDVTDVLFNGVPATSFTRVSATQLTAVVPARVATGTISIRVNTRAGTAVRLNAFTYISGATLRTGQWLSSATALRSPTGAYVATMQADGNLVITSSSGVRRWASGTTGAGNRLQVRADGNVVMLRSDGTVAWSTGTDGWTGGLLTLTDNGLLEVRQGTTTVWDHRGRRYDRLLPGQVLRSGESLVSAGASWQLTMRTDGDLVLTSASGVRTWAAFTSGAGSSASMQTDGNFVVRNSAGVSLWSTRTTGAGSFLRVLGDANAAVYRGSTVTWAVTGGPAPSSWTCYSRATQDCIERFGYHGQRAWNYPVDRWGNNCTNFSAYRLSVDGVKNPGNLGNATSWDSNARAKGFAVDQRPRVGDIAQWNSNHVAYVDWVSADGDTVAISESGYGGTVLGTTYTSMSGRRILARGSYSWPSNFIHFR